MKITAIVNLKTQKKKKYIYIYIIQRGLWVNNNKKPKILGKKIK